MRKSNVYLFGLSTLIIVVLCMSYVSAFDFDNVKSYDAVKNEITISNCNLWVGTCLIKGEDYAKAKLDTPQINYVMPGIDRKVAEITINSYTDYENFIGGIELYNNKDGGKINRVITYKYKTYEDNYVDVPVEFKKVCNSYSISKDKTQEVCNDVPVAWKTENIPKEVWLPLDKLDIKTETLTIGLFTDVYSNDDVEWIPTMFGKEITEWATFTDAMKIGLVAYWSFDTTSNDTINNKNCTLNGNALINQTYGKFGGSLQLDGTADYVNCGSPEDGTPNATLYQKTFNGTRPFTISMWINASSYSNLMGLMGNADSGPSNGWAIRLPTGNIDLVKYSIASQAKPITLVAKNWTHLTISQNLTGVTYYQDGLPIGYNNEASAIAYSGYPFVIGSAGLITGDPTFNGLIDEVGFWNRTLTDAEVALLPTSTYSGTINPTMSITNSYPINDFNTTSSTVNFGCNVTGSVNNNITSIYLNVSGSGNFTQLITIPDANTPSYNATFTNSSLPDGTFNWNCYSYGSGGINASSSILRLNKDGTNPLISVIYPSGLQGAASPPYNVSLNFSVVDNNLQSCWYHILYNYTNVSIPSCANTTITIRDSQGTNTIYVWANDSFGNSNYGTSNFSFIKISEGYSTSTMEGNRELFIINVSITPPTQVSTANLIYNNTEYPGTLNVLGGGNYSITKSLNIPLINAITNITFWWNITLNDGTNFLTPLHNQTVNNLNIGNCTQYEDLIMNLSYKDEDTRTLLNATSQNATIEVELLIYPIGSNNTILMFNQSFKNNSNPQICMNNLTSSVNYRLDGIIRYVGNDYVSEFYNIQNQALNNVSTPININLYDLLILRSQEFLVTYKDSNFIPQSNVLVTVSRKYIPSGTFETVEVAKTDTAGQTLVHLVLSEVIYTITITRDGQLLAILDSVLARCDNIATGTCTIPINELATTMPLDMFKTAGGITYSQTFEESTRTLSLIFTSNEGIKTVSLNATKFDRFGNTSVCSDSLTSSTGTLTCTIPASFGNSTIISTLYSDGEAIGESYYSLKIKPSEVSGAEGIILAIIIIITLTMLFISSIYGVLFGAIIGLVFCGSLFLFEGGSLFGKAIGIFIYIFVCIGIIAWKLKNSVQS